MVRFGNLHRLRRCHRKRMRYLNWTVGKADSVLHPDSGLTHHFQALLRSSPLPYFICPSLARYLVSSFLCVCHPHFARPYNTPCYRDPNQVT
jgi:hypothetical protein